jgi:hypothetical protein
MSIITASMDQKTNLDNESPILTLPDELFLNVLGHINDHGIKQIRLVCRSFESKSTDDFGDRYFRHLLVMHHARSVGILQGIANHPRWKNCVREITISGEIIKGDVPNKLDSCANWYPNFISAIQQFPHLRMVAIDNASLPFFGGDRAADALRCGRAGFDASQIPDKTTEEGFYEFPEEELICNCIFRIALDALSKSTHLEKVELHLWIFVESESQNLFDPRSSLWNDSFANRVNFLRLIVDDTRLVIDDTRLDTDDKISSTWVTDLLYCIPKLQHLGLCGEIRHMEWSKVSWSLLHAIELAHLTLPSDGFVKFIVAHSATLSFIALSYVKIQQGTWMKPLQKITKMDQLCRLDLSGLYQTTPSTQTANPLPAKQEKACITIEGKTHIKLVAEVFRTYFWTIKLGNETHKVDLRQLKAVVAGEITYKHGRWS